ncbi:NUDIX domain protein [Bacteriovorax sp. BSW11_IV]|uniref:MBL fold metallo-hydrolase n=1 Tax=Bacteriovorax sp. BSW11_IV TaxID=1353529 RepID=UPI00038A44A0|nr:MBL fold metallo-hydrolase [Bacteriovorax sp. BSW11_IV]EQC50307.1 NUDIX domain protein [Bacteriovorax sp. BSW11_IV]
MRESCAVIFKCVNEYFVVKRSEKLSVFPGYHAFVGGKVDEGEGLLEALKREVMEEVGHDLDQVISLEYLCYATTPEFNPYRFKTHFYIAHVHEKPQFTLLEHEIQSGHWLTSEEFLNLYDKGDALAVPPIIKLFKMDFNVSNEDIVDVSPKDKIPLIEPVKDFVMLFPLSHTFPPANRTNCFFIGDKFHNVLVDPSPKDGEELQKLMNTLNDYPVEKIFITHHHPDHHEFADILARTLNVPVLCSADTKNRIEKRYNPSFFKDIDYREIQEGDVVTIWRGENVYAMAVPGHDEGQLALFPESKKWVLVSDLIQTIGTVVIGGDEGDMGKYYRSLEKVIDMRPSYIFPSHGIGLGGIEKLRTTLKHRKMREEQIDKLYKDGLSEKEILAIVYEGLSANLEKYAMKTIRAHLIHLGHFEK